MESTGTWTSWPGWASGGATNRSLRPPEIVHVNGRPGVIVGGSRTLTTSGGATAAAAAPGGPEAAEGVELRSDGPRCDADASPKPLPPDNKEFRAALRALQAKSTST